METVLIVLAVLVVLAGAFWLVRRRRPASAPSAAPLLGTGWQFYSRPTELEPRYDLPDRCVEEPLPRRHARRDH